MPKIDKGRRQNGRDSTRGDLSVTILRRLLQHGPTLLASPRFNLLKTKTSLQPYEQPVP